MKRWIDTPSTYNYMLAAMTRLFGDAGLAARNPMKSIDRRGVAKRDIYVTDDQYIAIIAQVEAGAGYHDKKTDWIARAVDLVYLVSHNPSDVLAIQETDITAYTRADYDPDTDETLYGDLLIERGKTGQAVLIYCNADLWDLIEGFAFGNVVNGSSVSI